MKVIFAILFFGSYPLSKLVHKDSPNIDEKIIPIYMEIFLVVYSMTLMFVLTILGGHSSTGTDFSDKILWILLLITIWNFYQHLKKRKNKIEE